MRIKWRNKKAVKLRGPIPTIPEEEIGNDFGSVISGDFGNGGDQITLPEQQETNTDEKALGDVEMGGRSDRRRRFRKGSCG